MRGTGRKGSAADDGTDRDDPGVPTAEESWQRHVRILELVERIRRTRAAGRPSEPRRPAGR